MLLQITSSDVSARSLCFVDVMSRAFLEAKSRRTETLIELQKCQGRAKLAVQQLWWIIRSCEEIMYLAVMLVCLWLRLWW